MLRSDRLLYEISPRDFNGSNQEVWSAWKHKANLLLPNFPDEVLQQWVYEHWKGVISHWGWLDLTQLTFELKSWPTQKLLDINSTDQATINKLAERVSHSIYQRSWLVQQMLKNGTWPIAPIVLSHSDDLFATRSRRLEAPNTLLEGHHRFAYLRGLKRCGEPLKSQHKVWVATLS